jgi:general secretion pathway protein A
MYRDFFGFSIYPFELTPDSNFFYLSHELKEVFATLVYGINLKRGFMLLVGEPGTGKTTLLNALINKSGINANFAYISNPDVNFVGLLHILLIEFGLASVDDRVTKTKALLKLKMFINEQFEKDRNVVIVIDEAQELDSKTLEKLRLLSNLQTLSNKLIQIILSGQPKLENTISENNLTQLAQRIGLRCRTTPLNEKDTYEYIEHRINVAGYKGPQLFGNKAKYLIWTYSKGIPRVINVICNNCLLYGYGADKKRIDSHIVKEVVDDLNKVSLDSMDSPEDMPKDTIKAISQTEQKKSDAISEVPPEVSPKTDRNSYDIVDKLRKRFSRYQGSETDVKKDRRFSAVWIAVISGIVIMLNIFILLLVFGSFKEFRNEFSSKLEAIKNNFQSQSAGIENRENKTPSDNKLTTDKTLPISGAEVKNYSKKNTVVVRKGDSLSDLIIRVYGKNDPKILDAILKINPEIKDPNLIDVNQVIRLPEKINLD